jgi:hypothetical protein
MSKSKNSKEPINGSSIALSKTLSLIRQETRAILTLNPHQISVDQEDDRRIDFQTDFSLVIPYAFSTVDNSVEVTLQRSNEVGLAQVKKRE